MRNIVLLCAIFFGCVLPASAATPNPADYSIDIRIVANRISHPNEVHLYTLIDGKTVELEGFGKAPLVLGTYKARISSNKRRNTYEVLMTYEILFPDGKTSTYDVVGLGSLTEPAP